MKKTTFRRQYILLLTLLFSYGFLFTSQYFDYSFSDEYAAIAFIITGISIFLVVFVYLREVKSASVLHTELYFKEVQLRETLNSLEEGVITTDMNGLIYDMNVSAERMTGWKKHEVINWPLQRVYNVVNEETGLPVQSIVSRILKYGKPIEFENNTILRGRNLDEIIISNSGSPLISSNGKVRGVVLVFRDISSNIEAENQLNQFKHFFNNSHDFACIAHLNGYFELLNPNFQKVLGYTNEEMLSAPFIHFIHPEDVAATLHEVEKLAGGALTINFTNRYRKKDSSYIWFEWNASPDKKTGKLYCIARDITERKAAQQAIDQLNKNLEIKIAERTAQLEVSKNELEAFTYSVSHDLRAPLRAVNNYAQMLWEDYSDILDQNGKRILNVIGKNAEKMGILIDDLLALSHLGKQEIQKTVVNMNELITNVLEDLNQSFPNKAEITIGNMPFVIGDSSLISHVVTNIMSNAIKYSSKREDPKIEITASHDLSNVIFCVRDNGVGFDMRYANKLFGVFQRLHLEKDFEGIGVGLAIANRIITRHGGRMWAESTLNQGAAFYFTLESVSK